MTEKSIVFHYYE